jgi:DNA-binding transcriptional MerR regulator
MDNVKNVFSIKDFENLSGIKAHTIRIWEKRYSILEPLRSDTNIRYYDIKNLRKLLNIVLLHNYGYKISKISKLNPEELNAKVLEIISEKSIKTHAIKSFKVAMMTYDHSLFSATYDHLLKNKTFKEVFYDVFIPLMEELGFLWQTDTISIAHEHFITFLIKQKLLSLTEKIQIKPPTKLDRIFVLFLPLNEIHELGLMYINHELIDSGYHTLYLGESMPVESLVELKTYFNKITFISYLTVKPTVEKIPDFIRQIETKLLNDTDHNFMLLGKMTAEINRNNLSEKIKIYNSIPELTLSIYNE